MRHEERDDAFCFLSCLLPSASRLLASGDALEYDQRGFRLRRYVGEMPMRMQDIDLRWVFVIVVVVLLLLRGSIFQGPLGVVLALIAGSYLCTVGWERLRGGATPLRSTKTTYWRGQRVELRPDRRASAPP